MPLIFFLAYRPRCNRFILYSQINYSCHPFRLATLSTVSQQEGEEVELMDSQNTEEEDDTMSGGVEGYMSTEEDSPGLVPSSQGSAGTEHRVAYLREKC